MQHSNSGKCLAGHTFQWESSDVVINQRQAKIYMDNLHFSAAIVLSGNHFHKIKMLSDTFGLLIPCSSTFHAHQWHYICSGVNTFYLKELVHYMQLRIPDVKSHLHQEKLLCQFKDKSLLLAGDGRCDFPGSSEKFCSYSLMEMHSHKILHVEMLDKERYSCTLLIWNMKRLFVPWRLLKGSLCVMSW